MVDESPYTSWMFRGRNPPSDSAYFENLTRCVFQSGLNWETIAKRWPAFKVAFEGFDISRVASYQADDITRLMRDHRIIRNRRKILATIHNAREFERIIQESGDVATWLKGLDKSNNYQGVVRRLVSRFKHIGVISTPIWLYSVGEEIDISSFMDVRFRKR
jgi:DNA-3-methyladenine glycosylase I